MAYARTADVPRGFVESRRTPGSGRSLLRRLRDALARSHQRAVDREIAAFLGGRGGKLTDTVEREIERRWWLSSRG